MSERLTDTVLFVKSNKTESTNDETHLEIYKKTKLHRK